jgi:hypothetical protein
MEAACDTHGRKKEVFKGFWSGNMGERDHLNNLDVDGRIILKLTFNKSCEHVYETSVSIKCEEFLY